MCLNLLRDSTFWVFWVLEIKMVPMNINDAVSAFFFSKFSFYFQLEWGALGIHLLIDLDAKWLISFNCWLIPITNATHPMMESLLSFFKIW